MPRPNLIYVLADGAHARFVERNPDTGAFVSFQQMDGSERLDVLREEQRDEPSAGRSFESSGGQRHGVGREDSYDRAKAAFVTHVAYRLNQIAADRQPTGVVLVAPAKLLGPLREGVAAHVPVTRELGKDLTHTPDHELGKWLDALASPPGTPAG